MGERKKFHIEFMSKTSLKCEMSSAKEAEKWAKNVVSRKKLHGEEWVLHEIKEIVEEE